MKKIFTLSLLVILLAFSVAYADDSADKQIAPKQYGTVIRKIPLVEQNGALSRLAGYRVVYEYLGKQYSVLMPDDPGDKVVILAPPAGMNTAPTVQMSAAVPIKPPTTAEINTALTPPVTVMIAPGYPPLFMLFLRCAIWILTIPGISIILIRDISMGRWLVLVCTLVIDIRLHFASNKLDKRHTIAYVITVWKNYRQRQYRLVSK